MRSDTKTQVKPITVRNRHITIVYGEPLLQSTLSIPASATVSQTKELCQSALEEHIASLQLQCLAPIELDSTKTEFYPSGKETEKIGELIPEDKTGTIVVWPKYTAHDPEEPSPLTDALRTLQADYNRLQLELERERGSRISAEKALGVLMWKAEQSGQVSDGHTSGSDNTQETFPERGLGMESVIESEVDFASATRYFAERDVQFQSDATAENLQDVSTDSTTPPGPVQDLSAFSGRLGALESDLATLRQDLGQRADALEQKLMDAITLMDVPRQNPDMHDIHPNEQQFSKDISGLRQEISDVRLGIIELSQQVVVGPSNSYSNNHQWPHWPIQPLMPIYNEALLDVCRHQLAQQCGYESWYAFESASPNKDDMIASITNKFGKEGAPLGWWATSKRDSLLRKLVFAGQESPKISIPYSISKDTHQRHSSSIQMLNEGKEDMIIAYRAVFGQEAAFSGK